MDTGKHFGAAISLAILVLVGCAAAGSGPGGPSDEAVAKLVARLGAADFRERQQASEHLVKLGEPILPALRKAAATKIDLEVKRRVELVMSRIEAATVERLLNAYCSRHELARDKVEPWESSLAPKGRVFRYKLAAVPAKDKQPRLPERHAFVFVDPGAGNVYDVKQFVGGDKVLTPRTLAIMRLMGTKIADSGQAKTVLGDLYRIQHELQTLDWDGRQIPARLTWLSDREEEKKPPTSYGVMHNGVSMTLRISVDEDGYVTSFSIGNIR